MDLISDDRLLSARHDVLGIPRYGLLAGGWRRKWNDTYHTLLNMPRYAFLPFFFSVFITEFVVFALLYMTQRGSCLGGGVVSFSHAMWIAVQTSSTIGFTSELYPEPGCTSINVLLIFQVITSMLIDYCMMGLVFARFASPNQRSHTLRFSSCAVLFTRPEDGLACLGVRVANVRKHGIINPSVSFMLGLPGADDLECGGGGGGAADSRPSLPGELRGTVADGGAAAAAPHRRASESPPPKSADGGSPAEGRRRNQAEFCFQELDVEGLPSQLTRLRLGMHAQIEHVISPRQLPYAVCGTPYITSHITGIHRVGARAGPPRTHTCRPGGPLFGRSLASLAADGAELVCVLSGTDQMTSNDIQSWRSYTPSEVRPRRRFAPVRLAARGGRLGLDLASFDATVPAESARGAHASHGPAAAAAAERELAPCGE